LLHFVLALPSIDHQRRIALCDSLFSALHCSLANEEERRSCLKARIIACYSWHVLLQDVCERVIASQSHNIHSVMDFEPFGPAGLFLRVTLTFIVIRSEPLSELSLYQWVFRCCACLLSWGLLCSVCAALGFLLKRLAHLYMQHYDDWYNAKSGRGLNMRTERLGSENNLGKQE
jgi:hypothetical protein